MNPWLCNLLFNNSGGSSLPATGQTFYASLKTSLVPEVGTGGPTWSRATAAWRFNDLGYLRQIPSGCAEFGGARLVVNLCTGNSDNFSGATLGRCSIVSAAVANHRGTNTAVKYLLDNTNGSHYARIPSSAYAGMSIRVSVVVKRNEYQYISVRSGQDTTPEAFNLTTNTWINVAQAETIARSFEVIDATWIRLTVASTVSTGTKYFGVGCSSSLGLDSWTPGGTENFTIADFSICDYESYVPEYVSVGVLSAPYHGAGADGCKYFATDWQGAPIPVANLTRLRKESAATNALLYSRDLRQRNWTTTATGSEFVVNGGFAADTDWTEETGWSIAAGVATKIAGTGGSLKQTILTTAGKTYYVEIILTVSAGTLSVSVGSSGIQTSNISSSGTYTYKIIAGTGAQVLNIYGSAAYAGTVDSVSVKESAVQTTTATGLDGIANTASTLTAGAADAIILQSTSGIASAARCASAYVKRVTGTGTISFTQDGGSTWTDITSQLNSSTYSRVQITATLANPSVGLKISTSGDAIAVDCVQNEAGSVATSPIVTTTATVTRNADSLTYQTASNWSDTAGTAYILAKPVVYSGGAVGSATNGLLLSASNSGATAYDGTNSANGPTGTPGAVEKLALAWGSSTMSVASSGLVGTPGTYDGAMGLSSVGVGVGAVGYFGDVAIYNYKMTDAELQAITT